jgi:hypothetical protein
VAARGFSDKKEEKNAEQGNIRCGPRAWFLAQGRRKHILLCNS